MRFTERANRFKEIACRFKLTEREEELLLYSDVFQDKNNQFAMSKTEICERMGYPRKSEVIRRALKGLVQKKILKVKSNPGRASTYTLTLPKRSKVIRLTTAEQRDYMIKDRREFIERLVDRAEKTWPEAPELTRDQIRDEIYWICLTNKASNN